MFSFLYFSAIFSGALDLPTYFALCKIASGKDPRADCLFLVVAPGVERQPIFQKPRLGCLLPLVPILSHYALFQRISIQHQDYEIVMIVL
ncbi:hypothetical protein BDW62DRAFT_111652 [Aspergillus aurantiobrunneus]